MKKRITALFLVASLLAFGLAGCQAADNEAPPADAGGSVSQPVEDEKTGGGEGEITAPETDSAYKAVPSGGVAVSDPGVLPIVEEKTDMMVYIQQSTVVEDYETNKQTIFCEEQTNVHLLWNVVPEQDATQKLNLLLASGQDLPDVIMSNLNTGTVVTNANQGLFIPLNDLIDRYAYWYDMVREKEQVLDRIMTTPDGKQYSMPRIAISMPNAVSGRGWMNQNFLDNLNLTAPTTTEELYTVLKAFKEQDANGNGDTGDEYPWIGSNNGWQSVGDQWLMNSFIQYDRNSPYYIKNGIVEAAYDKDAYREGLRFWRRLAAEGLFDTTTFTQDQTQLKQVFDGEIALVGLLTSGGQFSICDQQGERSREYVSISTMIGPDGYHGVYYDPFGSYGYEVANTVITSACKNPEMAFRWIDYRYSREVSMRNRLGEPGVDYIVPENGEMAVDGTPASFQPVLIWGSVQNSHWGPASATYNDFDNNNVKEDDPYELQQYLWNASEQNYYPYINDISCYYNANTFYSEEDSAVLADINATLRDYIRQAMSQFVTGDLDIEKDWDQYLKNLEGMRYKELVAIYQKYV